MVLDRSLGMARVVNHVHMIGVGGIGMSGIAEILVNSGYSVSGSDLRASKATKRLQSMGVDLNIGHEPNYLLEADVVVISTAIKEDNAELIEARRRHIPVIRRAEMLAELMRTKFGVAIAGAHGKTTTTSMIASVLGGANLDPTVVVGGILNQVGSNAVLGAGPYMVVEADESDGSFLYLSPTIAVVTNIDAEHLDFYTNGMEEIRGVFRDFLKRLPFYGLAVLCMDHPEVQALLPDLDRRVLTYGLNPKADIRAKNIRILDQSLSFEVIVKGQSRGEYQLSMLGRHNVQNALAALAVAEELGVTPDKAKSGLETFAGVDRRFSIRGEVGGVMVVDDYGHHPTEINATLAGARSGYPSRRILTVFQPHRYSRTASLIQDFGRAFHESEKAFVLPIYAAGEVAISGIDNHALVDVMLSHGHRHAEALPDLETAVEIVASQLQNGDLLIIFGAGDVGQLGGQVLEKLKALHEVHMRHSS